MSSSFSLPPSRLIDSATLDQWAMRRTQCGVPETDGGAATTQLIVVRHGESNYNRDRRWQGQAQDAVLTELGWLQAECAADALTDIGAAALFSSDLTRSMQTAVAIAHVTGRSDREPQGNARRDSGPAPQSQPVAPAPRLATRSRRRWLSGLG